MYNHYFFIIADYKKDDLSPLRLYFTLKDELVCLIASLNLNAEKCR